MKPNETIRALLSQLERQWEADKSAFSTERDGSIKVLHWIPSSSSSTSPLSETRCRIKVRTSIAHNGLFAMITMITTCAEDDPQVTWKVGKHIPRFLFSNNRRFERLYKKVRQWELNLSQEEKHSSFVKHLNKVFPSAIDKLLLGDKYGV